jgi:hypothetical protein
MRHAASRQRFPDPDNDAPPIEPEPERDAEEGCDAAAAWQQWLYEAALGGSPAPVHLPRRLVRRIWARTIGDRVPASREREM